MRAKHLKILLEYSFKNHHQVLIKGAPGVGKSDVVTQATNVCIHTDGLPYDLLVVTPSVQDPTEPGGIPWVVQNETMGAEVQKLPFANIKQMINATRPLVVFLDDLGQAAPAVQAAYMQLLLARQLDGTRISDHVIFVAATNRRQDNANVSGILLPVRSRFHTIVELEPNSDDWCEWGVQNNMPHSLLSFIRFRPQYILNMNPSKDIENTACPRTIANLGKMINSKLPKEIRFETYKGAVGESFTIEFQAFCNVFLTLPTIAEIENSPVTAALPTEISGQFAIMGMLIENASVDNIGAFVSYMKRIGRDELLVAFMKDAAIKNPRIISTSAYTNWAVQNGNMLINM